MITKEKKQELVKKFRVHSKDTGSPDVQIALLSDRMNNLSAHLGVHKKDKHSRRGLLMMIAKRRKLLKYLLREEPKRYEEIIKSLNIRRIK
ncbi:30S ribosomal protein S15 [candidate division WOR-3 bacterium]|nr:30S ribosomal protein S15 [candidate division WOR-3 bacterium]